MYMKKATLGSVPALIVDQSRARITHNDESVSGIKDPKNHEFKTNIDKHGENSQQDRQLFKIIMECLLFSMAHQAVFFYIAVIILLGLREWTPMLQYNIIQLIVGIMVVLIFQLWIKLSIYWRIWKQDHQLVQIYNLSSTSFIQARWYQVCTGNIIRLTHGELCPADGFILATNGPNKNVEINQARVFGRARNEMKVAQITDLELKAISIEGSIECDYKFVDKTPSRVAVRLNQHEHDIQITSEQKIKRYGENVSNHDILVVVSNKNKKYKYHRINYPGLLDNKIVFQIQLQTAMTVVLCLIICIMLCAGWTAQQTPDYLNTKVIHTYFSNYVNYIGLLFWGVPLLQYPIIYLILWISQLKLQNDDYLDPNISGQTSSIKNMLALSNIANARCISVNLNYLSRPVRTVSNVILNKMSEEVNIQNPYQLAAIDEIEDEPMVQRNLQYPLLSLGFKQRNADDIAIQQYILQKSIYQCTLPTRRIIQDVDMIADSYDLQFEVNDDKMSLKLFTYGTKQKPEYMLIYRSYFNDCKDLISESVYNQALEQIQDISNVILIFKRMITRQFSDKLIGLYKINKTLDQNTMIQIQQDLELMNMVELEDSSYDASIELMDLITAKFRVVINAPYEHYQMIVDDSTTSTLLTKCHQIKLICGTPDELQVAMDQAYIVCKLVGNRYPELYNGHCPAVAIIDQSTFNLGMRDLLLQDKFKLLLLQCPFLILLNFSSRNRNTLKECFNKLKIIACIQSPKDIINKDIVTVSTTYNQCDINVPTFSTLTVLLLTHARLILIRIRMAMNQITYSMLTLLFSQAVYSAYNRSSWQPFFTLKMQIVYTTTITIYNIVMLSFTQDYPFHIFRQVPLYDHMIRTAYNPYKAYVIQIFIALYHASAIIMLPIGIFYGTNDANGYVHGVQLYQVVSYIFLMIVVMAKPLLEMHRVVSIQIIIALVCFTISVSIAFNMDDDLSHVFDTGLKTKELCSLIFVPICILCPNFITMHFRRLILRNTMNTQLYKAEGQINEELENISLKEANNYVKLNDKERDPEEIVQVDKSVM